MDSPPRPSSQIYSALQRPDSFRLLELAPVADDHEPFGGSLVVLTLAEHDRDVTSRYTALSYVWADPTPVETIAVDGCDVGITANLSQALRDIRHNSRVVVLWADALCINQQDTRERSHQVRNVGDIYRRASTTIIYLGPYNVTMEWLFTSMAATNLVRIWLQSRDPPVSADSNSGSGSASDLRSDYGASLEEGGGSSEARPETVQLGWRSRKFAQETGSPGHGRFLNSFLRSTLVSSAEE